MPHFPYTPTETGMPGSTALLFSTLGMTASCLSAPMPVGVYEAQNAPPEAREVAGWLEFHGFLRVVGGYVHLTASGLTYLSQLEIAADSLSRQFRNPPRVPVPPADVSPALN